MILITVFVLSLTGAGFSRNNPVLDLEKSPVYESLDIPRILLSAETYENRDVVIGGSVKTKASGNKSFTLADRNNEDLTLEITYSDSAAVSKLELGSIITVFGQVKLSLLNKDLSISASYLSPEMALLEDFYFEGGEGRSVGKTVRESIADGKIKYYIPGNYLAAKLSGEDKDKVFNIDAADGNCYYLNSIKGKNIPEALCVYYIDSEKYVKYNSDYAETEAIERAIVANVCPDEDSKLYTKIFGTEMHSGIFPTKSVSRGFGRTYDYYNVTYSNSHHVEFVFTPVTGGICVVMYIYSVSDSKNDLLFLLRTLETE